MSDDRLLDDLGAFAASLERATSESNRAFDGARRERLQDALRSEMVASRYREAASAGRAESRRILWRAVRPRWIERATAEVAAELRRFDTLERRAAEAAGMPTVAEDSFVALARCADDAQRERIGATTLERVARRTSNVEALLEAGDAAARRIGARDRVATLDATSSGSRAVVLDEFERVALAPLDDAVASGSRDRANGDPVPHDVPARVALLGRRAPVPRAIFRRAVIEAATAIAPAPSVEGPPRDGATRWTALGPGESGFQLRLGALDGPTALTRTLEALGRSLRARFLESLDPLRRRWLDPTYECAAGVLFRRLALDPGFIRACGVSHAATLVGELRFEASLAPRLAWAYVHQGPDGSYRSRRTAFAERVRRAAGRHCWPGEWMEVVGNDAYAIGALRGEMLGVLYEERLLTRHGRSWFRERAARGTLRELWDAERQATPDDVAGVFGLGTIDGATILERCRP